MVSIANLFYYCLKNVYLVRSKSIHYFFKLVSPIPWAYRHTKRSAMIGMKYFLDGVNDIINVQNVIGLIFKYR